MALSEVYVALKMSPERERQLRDELRSRGLELRVVSTLQLVETLSDIEFLILGRPPRIDWSRAGKLRLIHIAGSGVDPLFPAQGLPPEVVVTNSRGAHADLVRDHVLALLLALFRDLPRTLRQQASHEWRSYPTVSVTGKKLCIVGLGEVGSRVARVASALGMHVSGVCRTPRPMPGIERVVGCAQLREVIGDVDAIALCVPLTSETHQLFDAGVIDALPPGVRLINVSRGAVLDQKALERALSAGRLTAGLDVFETEPLPATSPLWDCPGLIVSPHVAGFSADYLDGVLSVFFAAREALLQGRVPPTVVSREHEY